MFHGNVDRAQMTWNNQTAAQIHNDNQQITPGFEAIAKAVTDTLGQLPAIGLEAEDQQDAEAVGNEAPPRSCETNRIRGRIRRAVAALRGYLTPVAAGAAHGAAEGAQELARGAVEHLGSPF